ncbi:hypothetical protein AAG570_009919 [Ranatra chinensis]|uniref:Cytochrome c oxidase subunit 4 n=1 Tax=Ranatra chinensis TaxID=642074 RepID=A0ABD0YQI8_9HEMI
MLLRKLLHPVRRFSASVIVSQHIDPAKIGSREVVGHGINGQAIYVDTPLFPYPAIRFREISSQYKALREKEKGDWKALSMEEKKCLYRISFCQTFSEMNAPTGEWKSIIGFGLIILSLGVYVHLAQSLICHRDLPQSFDKKNQQAQLKRIIDLEMNPVGGISSKWDYETGNWK